MPNFLASPTESMVKEVSGRFAEPEEISRERSVALEYFNKLPVEKSQLYTKYVDILSGLNLDSIELGLPSNSRTIPSEIAHLVKEKDEPTLALQVDSQMVRTEVHGALEKEGIVFSDVASALVKFPDLARNRFTKAIPPGDDKFAALNDAFFTAGTFLYVPKGLSVKIPFRNIVLLKTHGQASFAHNIIVAEENSKVNFLQEAYSRLGKERQGPALYSEVTEVYLGEGAEVNFASLQDFEGDVHSTVNRRSIGQKDSRINWTVGHLGGGTTRSRMDSVLDGPGSTAEHAMILSKKARADAIPGLEIFTNEVKATHSGSVSQVDEEQIFYLMSRGLSHSEAQRMVILGFLHPAVKRIPLRSVRAVLQFLIDEKWAGRGGLIPPRAEELPEFEEEPEKEAVEADLFERHYKYR